MSYSTWHDYGFGICVDDIKTTENKVFELIHLAQNFTKEFYEWIENFREDGDPESIAELITMDQIDEYEDRSCCMCGLSVIIKRVIEECEDIRLLACEDFNCYHYLIFSMQYPWYMSEKEKNMTEKDVYDLFNKYVSILTDEFISIDYQEVENGG
jgi:hypothetical protein